MKIRRYACDDAIELATLSRRTIHEVGSHDYTPRQVEVWAASAPTPEMIHERAGDGRFTWVAVDSTGKQTGFIDLERDGHIGFLYCAPEVVGKGIALAILLRLSFLSWMRVFSIGH